MKFLNFKQKELIPFTLSVSLETLFRLRNGPQLKVHSAVNDAFVTMAWKKHLGANSPKVRFLSDDTGAVSIAALLILCMKIL